MTDPRSLHAPDPSDPTSASFSRRRLLGSAVAVIGAGSLLGGISTLAGCATSRGTSGAREGDAPDLLIHNASITTLDPARPSAQALATRAGVITAIGSNAEILRLKSLTTTVINAQGRRLIPGLNDTHTHTVRGGLNYALELRWDGVTSLKQGLQMLREQVRRTPPGQWVRVVGGWSYAQFEE